MDIVDMYLNQKLSQMAIGKLTGHCPRTIRTALEKAGVKARKPFEHTQTVLSEEQSIQVVADYREGATVKETAKLAGLSKTTVRKAIGESLRSKGESVSTWAFKKAPVLSTLQTQMILGSLLGDSSLMWHRTCGPRTENFNYIFSCTHGPKQRRYLEHKKDLLGAPKLSHYIGGEGCFSPGEIYWMMKYQNKRALSKIASVVLKARKKTVSMSWLDMVENDGMAYWYMDDGSVFLHRGRLKVSFATNGFSLEEIIILQEWLRKKDYLNWRCEVKPGQYRIDLSVSSSRKFLQAVEPTVSQVECMKYKLI